MPTDEQLIMEINGGSQAALEVLTKRYYKHVYAYLYRKIGSTHTVYDLTQDVFVKMMRGLPTYTRKVSFHSWLYTIAVNCCRDYYRSAAYRQSLTAMEYEEYHQQSNGESVSYIFERRETRKQLRQAIQALPDVQSEDAGNTLELRWAGGSTITNGGAKARLSFISTGTRNFPRFAGQARRIILGGAFNWDIDGQYREYSTPYMGMQQVIRPDGTYNSQHRHGMYRWHVVDVMNWKLSKILNRRNIPCWHED